MQQPVTTVIFDYGGVLSLPVDPDSIRTLAEWCGLPIERFAAEHMRERLAYDRADTGLEGYWARILGLAGSTTAPGLLERLNREDLRGWGRINQRVLAWSRRLRAAGFRTAVLSNMPQPLLDLMNADPGFAWLAEFEARVFSCKERLVKPEPGIYRVLLDRLGETAGSCMFLDDSERNVAGARGAGIRAFHFRSADEAAGPLAELGLPPL
ncbi:MAG: HAD family phosphatase [Spirochaetes bacterium]|nr:HAD family phosphatase [Spirochaetota bacterium]